MEKVKVLIVRFGNEITREEIPLFRGSIVNAMENANLLFHNHVDGGGLRYAYPLIQYKRINQKAAIVCLGEGTDAIGQFFSSCNFDVALGERQVKLEVESVKAEQHLVQIWDGEFAYHIRRWLPLNQDNYETYCQEESLAERCALLERLLTANILSFAKGMGIHFDEQVVAKITQLDNPRTQYYKGVRLLSFDAEFKTNVSLPDYIGLGKGVSLGMGTVVRKLSAYEKVFLLGGHDLEMETIKEMTFKQPDCKVFDLDLAWDNAKLSAYRDVIDWHSNSNIYAVELQEDMELPVRYHRIDHHNDMNGRPSSLEQVAALLGVELNRYQMLVAANDSGYIPAMKALGATDEEILEIRLRDRAAQGVTEDDERLAEQSLRDGTVRSYNIVVVKSQTSKFSTICDRVYPYKRLLIYTDQEWVFYGEGKSELVERLSEVIRQNKVFHGGGDNGYIGSVKGAYKQEEIEQFVNQIKERYDK